jgi:hypothetical protein
MKKLENVIREIWSSAVDCGLAESDVEGACATSEVVDDARDFLNGYKGCPNYVASDYIVEDFLDNFKAATGREWRYDDEMVEV